jgi:hypothetical protein
VVAPRTLALATSSGWVVSIGHRNKDGFLVLSDWRSGGEEQRYPGAVSVVERERASAD